MRDPAPDTEYARNVRTIPRNLPFDNGDEMDQPTFHALYEKAPEGFRAELIDGVVYFKMPTLQNHGRPHAKVITWLSNYSAETPSTDVSDAPTLKLGLKSEPEPDGCLYLLPEVGGACRVDDEGYLSGPPELVVEVANTTMAIDLGRKKRDYEQSGVKEYVVVLPVEKSIIWYYRRKDRFVELQPTSDGYLKSHCFPGLWLNAGLFFSNGAAAVLRMVRFGLSSPEHAVFVEALNARRKKAKGSKKQRRKS